MPCLEGPNDAARLFVGPMLAQGGSTCWLRLRKLPRLQEFRRNALDLGAVAMKFSVVAVVASGLLLLSLAHHTAAGKPICLYCL